MYNYILHAITTLLTPAYWPYNSVYQSLLLNTTVCMTSLLNLFVHVPCRG